MHYRRLGSSGMKVSTVALGGWINYGEGKVEQESGRKIVERAYELGINYFDLADVYGRGGAEKEMGAVLKQYPRHTLVIASKVFGPMSDEVNDRGLSRKHILESIDKSLLRLGTDYLDIYFCHRPDPDAPIEETARAMHTIIEQGKVLHWGTSEWNEAQLVEAYEVCEHYSLHKPRVEQPQYSMLVRENVEAQLRPVAEPRGIGLVVWSPLAMGMLTGKYDAGVPEDSRFGREEWAKERYLTDETAEKVRRLKPIADELGISRAQLALAWALRLPLVSSVITGATKVQQVEDNARAAEVALSEDVVRRIEEILGNTP
ncbi:MAG: aldo/keto reductase family protein [Ardenticatenales bacterium]|nr:aldo/keto reductase family protein [Ardenticatenales bacterium]